MFAEMASQAALASIAGALLSLDRTAAFQTMVSRPIVAAPLIGLILGSPWTGLLSGIALELLFIGDPPVGAYVPVHETGLSVLVTAMAVTALKASGSDEIALERASMVQAMFVVPAMMLAAIPVAKLYQKADSITRAFNARFFRKVEEDMNNGRPVNVFRENLKGLIPFFVTSLLTLFATSLALMLLTRAVLTLYVPDELMMPAFLGCLLLGLSSAYFALETAHSRLIFAVTGFLATSVWVFVRGV